MDPSMLLLLARDLLSLRVKPGFLRVYLVGAVLALLGAAVGAAEMLRLTFSADHNQDGPERQYEELLNTLQELQARERLHRHGERTAYEGQEIFH